MLDIKRIQVLFKRLGKWKWIGLSLILVLALVFREYIVQFILLLVLLACIGYVLYKSANYIVRISVFSVKLFLKIVAFTIALGVVVLILSKF